MTLQEDYRVTLDAFQGPLDLLLFLIRRAEVDVTEIAVSQVTDQYLAFLTKVEDIDVEVAGEFLVMAATLIELKSRTLMPPAPEEAAGDAAAEGGRGAPVTADPRSELVQQLLDYQRFRVAAEELDARRHAFARRFPLRPGRRPAAGEDAAPDRHDEPEPEPELELEDVHVMDLADAYERIMASIDFDRLGDHVVEMDDTPIALHQEDLVDRLRRAPEKRLTLQDVFEGRAAVHRVGLFLGALELARLRRVTVRQDRIEAPVEVVLLDDPPPDEAPPPPPA